MQNCGDARDEPGGSAGSDHQGTPRLPLMLRQLGNGRRHPPSPTRPRTSNQAPWPTEGSIELVRVPADLRRASNAHTSWTNVGTAVINNSAIFRSSSNGDGNRSNHGNSDDDDNSSNDDSDNANANASASHNGDSSGGDHWSRFRYATRDGHIIDYLPRIRARLEEQNRIYETTISSFGDDWLCMTAEPYHPIAGGSNSPQFMSSRIGYVLFQEDMPGR